MDKKLKTRLIWIFFAVAGLAVVFFGFWEAQNLMPDVVGQPAVFDGQEAYDDVLHQVALGPRIPGSQAHDEIILWMLAELEAAGWQAEIQEGVQAGKPVRNVISQRGEIDPSKPWVILGAHFDSRIFADQDPDPARRREPVPGANDGASGVAVLLELARVLPKDIPKQVMLVFFDAEDNGNIAGWDWILGSTYFVEQLEDKPDAAVVIDMIGDADLNIHLELNSDKVISAQIWAQAASLGYAETFIPSPKYRILDDHIPFRNAGIPAVDIIDFDYPFWHTLGDTPDKVSAESLKMVGDTLIAWLSGP